MVQLGGTDVAESLNKVAAEIAEQKIHPIVEFFQVDFDCRSAREFIDISKADRKLLRSSLMAAKGIYAFYNSEYEIIYLGKTKRKLWDEMKNAYSREMQHYERYKVHFARNKYTQGRADKVRPLKRSATYIYDCASYFSAYAIDDDALIDIVELMMIRLFPNDLLNVRMEGNTTLRRYVPPTPQNKR